MSVDKAYNFRTIEQSICTSGLLSEEQLSELHASGYEAVINLLPHDSEYAMYAYEHIGWPASRAREHIESIWRPEEHPPWDKFIATVLPSSG